MLGIFLIILYFAASEPPHCWEPWLLFFFYLPSSFWSSRSVHLPARQLLLSADRHHCLPELLRLCFFLIVLEGICRFMNMVAGAVDEAAPEQNTMRF